MKTDRNTIKEKLKERQANCFDFEFEHQGKHIEYDSYESTLYVGPYQVKLAVNGLTEERLFANDIFAAVIEIMLKKEPSN